MDIKTLREKIDGIDREILDLIRERFSLLPDVAQYKKENNLPIKDEPRERELISKQTERARGMGLSASFIKELFELIIAESRKIQNEQ